MDSARLNFAEKLKKLGALHIYWAYIVPKYIFKIQSRAILQGSEALNIQKLTKFICTAFIFCITKPLFSSQLVSAQQKPALSLPSSKTEKTAVFEEISRVNVSQYRDFLVPELFDLIREGKLVIQTAKDINPKPQLSDQTTPTAEDVKLSSISNYIGKDKPFALVDGFQINKNENERVKKILWNAQANFWKSSYFESSFQMLWFVKDNLIRGANGKYRRIYPKLLDPQNKTPQLFKEVFSLTEPEVLRNFSWLGFRFIGEDEDLLWLNSPALNKLRQLSGSNRGDDLLNTPFVPDDMLTFSGKIEFTEGESIAERKILLPVVESFDRDTAQNSSKCIELSQNRASPGIKRWNFDTRLYSAASWAPTGVPFIARDVFELHIDSTDFYGSSGRQIIYVDKESFLPVYKIVFDRAGKLKRIVMSSFGSVFHKTLNKQYFYPLFTLIVDRTADTASIIEYTSNKVCDQLPKDAGVEVFDPKAFNKTATAVAKES